MTSILASEHAGVEGFTLACISEERLQRVEVYSEESSDVLKQQPMKWHMTHLMAQRLGDDSVTLGQYFKDCRRKRILSYCIIL